MKAIHSSHLFGCFVAVSVGFAFFQLLAQHAILQHHEQSHSLHSRTHLGGGFAPASKAEAFLVNERPNQGSLIEKNSNGASPAYHMVFSTSCTPQQDWESMVFFYHAYKVRQVGTVTRIVSGCSPSDQRRQQEFFTSYIQPMNPSFAIHFTPDFANLKKASGHSYKYMNKPYGLQHWMAEVLHMHNTTKHDHDIIFLLDPDMILLRPLTHNFSDVDQHLWASNLTRMVKPGFPMCQQDGYLTSSWNRLNATHIMGEGHPPLPSNRDGPRFWNSGPPYLATARTFFFWQLKQSRQRDDRTGMILSIIIHLQPLFMRTGDMFRIVEKWTVFTPRVLDEYPELFAEMYGLIFATVYLQLPFTMVRSIVVSTTTTRDREGWEFVDNLTDEQICQPTSLGVKAPIALHYCKR